MGKLLLCCKYLAYKSWAENNKHSVSRMMIQRFGGNVLDRHPNPPKSSWGTWVWSDQLISLKQFGNSSWAGKLGTGKEVHILKNRVGRNVETLAAVHKKNRMTCVISCMPLLPRVIHYASQLQTTNALSMVYTITIDIWYIISMS